MLWCEERRREELRLKDVPGGRSVGVIWSTDNMGASWRLQRKGPEIVRLTGKKKINVWVRLLPLQILKQISKIKQLDGEGKKLTGIGHLRN